MFAAGAIGVAIPGGGLGWMSGGGDGARPVVSTAMHGSGAAARAPDPGAVALPARFSAKALEGQPLFGANCAVCHGAKAAGTDQGPPLIHRIYEPSHFGEYAFQMAVMNGLRAHHWRFGNMPPVPGLTGNQVAWITAHMREAQPAAGAAVAARIAATSQPSSRTQRLSAVAAEGSPAASRGENRSLSSPASPSSRATPISFRASSRSQAVELAPYGSDMRHEQGGLKISANTGLCPTTINVSNSSPGLCRGV